MTTSNLKSNLTGLFDEKTELRLFSVARSAYSFSPYGHGKYDGQSAEVAAASEIVKLGKSEEEAYEIAVEITARVIELVNEELAALAWSDALKRAARLISEHYGLHLTKEKTISYTISVAQKRQDERDKRFLAQLEAAE